MKVIELVGKKILDAYDGKKLSFDFGYSCANFNTNDRFSNHDNDEAMFDFYTKNTKNISCIAVFNEDGKICGRRMFFKGESLINDEDFEYPIKRGDQIKYLYGYYGTRKNESYYNIDKYVSSKYGKGIVFTDNGVLRDWIRDRSIYNFWIMGVEYCNFPKYPPIDILSICPELKALSNFEPRQYVLDVLERDYNKNNLSFHQAYRYSPNKTGRFDYKTWSDNYTLFDNSVQEEEDENYQY